MRTLQTDFQCKFSRSTEARKYGVRGYVRVPANNERALMDACSRVGPISIAINASPQSFIFYKGGAWCQKLEFRRIINLEEAPPVKSSALSIHFSRANVGEE